MVRMRFSSLNSPFSLLLSFVIICNTIICETKDSCNQKDKQILLCFRHGLIDQSGMLSTWSNNEDCCEWRGIRCDINGRVTNISLLCSTDDEYIIGRKTNKTHCLSGKIHLTLFELDFLNYLDLRNNDFKAIHLPMDCQNLSLVKTPHGSGNLSNVVHLDLSQNENLVIDDLRWLLRLSSSLQYLNMSLVNLHKETNWLQILTMFPSLSELYLSNCLLENVNPSLLYANFTSLEYLSLSGNNFFSELPVWLFNISGLSFLNLQENRFHGQIPETILNLKKLSTLVLADNKLSGKIPDWVGQLGRLHKLDLSSNSFTSSIPTAFGNLSSLIHLDLYFNLITSSIPTTFGNLSSLIYLDVSSNHLTGTLPQSLGQLSNLETLRVVRNYLSGVISKRNFANLSNLQKLSFGSPSFVFDFDPQWIPPFKLQHLFMEYVDLKLVPWFYTQTSLIDLEINYSLFKNVSQEMFWNLATHCQFLSLFNNTMPWDMSNVLLNSEIVWLDQNGLSGGLPRLTSNVSIFLLANNKLSGSLSPLLCHNMTEKSNLKYLDVSNNHLSGELTDCWVNWKSLIHVGLGRNNLTGMIPRSICTLSNLLSLNMYDNKLHGEILVSMKSCKKLVIVNLAKNKLSGNVPNWIGPDLKALQLRSNKFSGDIPPLICQLSSLFILDLANNRLTGTIPRCLHNITTMISNNASQSDDMFGITSQGLAFAIIIPLLAKGSDQDYPYYMHLMDLSNNLLSGIIPLELFRLTALQSLNLSENQLMGTIPKEIGNMKALESLDFSNNTLSGEIPQSMSALSFLEVLNLSFNNLKGQIPLGTQLQGFTSLSYMGNPELCGTPLTEKCNNNNGDTKVMAENDEEGSEFMEWFYMGMGVGFAVSFWIVFGSILLKRSWRHAYFNFLYDMKDKFMSRWS